MIGELKFSHSDLDTILKAYIKKVYNLDTYGRKLSFGITLDGVEHKDLQVIATFEVKQ